MVRVTLRQLIRFSQARKFGGPNIAGKINKGLPGFDAKSLAHNYSIAPMLAFVSIGGVILAWYVYVLLHPAEMTHQERANEPEGEKVAKGFFGMYHANKETPSIAPLSPALGKK